MYIFYGVFSIYCVFLVGWVMNVGVYFMLVIKWVNVFFVINVKVEYWFVYFFEVFWFY